MDEESAGSDRPLPQAGLSLELPANLLDIAFDGVWITDSQGRLLGVNASYCGLSGYTREELLSMSASDLEAIESLGGIASHIQGVRSEGSDRFVTQHRRKDGALVDLEVSVRIFPGDSGKLLAFFWKTPDYIHAEKTLRESERRFRCVFDQASMGIAMLALDGRIIMANPVFANLFGSSPGEVQERSYQEFVHPDDREPDRLLFSTLVEGRLPRISSEKRFLRKDGETVWARVAMSLVFTAGGSPQYAICLCENVTARRKAEDEKRLLEEQLRLARTFETVGRLAGGVAHDFNNLLTVINGYAELLLSRLEPADPSLRAVDQIRTAGERAASLTRQLLAFSRSQTVEPVLLDVNALIRESEPILMRLLGESIHLRMHLADSLSPVLADSSQMHQVFLNLFVNARDAMPRGGAFLVETAEVSGEDIAAIVEPELRAGSYVLVTLTDTGIGMDEETRSRIFEPFFTTKPAGYGTGLGLSTVYGIVNQAGGFITVESAPQCGSTFRVYLPVSDQATSPTPAPQAVVPERTEPKNILLVEDRDDARALVSELLEQLGHSVIDVSSAEAALDFIQERGGPPDLLLSDIVLPGLSGTELVSGLRTQFPALPVLFMTGYAGRAASTPGESPLILQKPFNSTELARAIHEVLKPKV